jgi:hypothetical protein
MKDHACDATTLHDLLQLGKFKATWKVCGCLSPYRVPTLMYCWKLLTSWTMSQEKSPYHPRSFKAMNNILKVLYQIRNVSCTTQGQNIAVTLVASRNPEPWLPHGMPYMKQRDIASMPSGFH